MASIADRRRSRQAPQSQVHLHRGPAAGLTAREVEAAQAEAPGKAGGVDQDRERARLVAGIADLVRPVREDQPRADRPDIRVRVEMGEQVG